MSLDPTCLPHHPFCSYKGQVVFPFFFQQTKLPLNNDLLFFFFIFFFYFHNSMITFSFTQTHLSLYTLFLVLKSLYTFKYPIVDEKRTSMQDLSQPTFALNSMLIVPSYQNIGKSLVFEKSNWKKPMMLTTTRRAHTPITFTCPTSHTFKFNSKYS